jgi:HEAT repeat protein
MFEAIAIILGVVLLFSVVAGLVASPVLAALSARGLYRLVVKAGQYPSRKAWAELARSLDFVDSGQRVMAGRFQGKNVRLAELWIGPVRKWTRIHLECEERLPPDLDVRTRTFEDESRGFQLVDPLFRRTFIVEGSDSAVLAALSGAARQALLELAPAGFLRITGSVVELEVSRPFRPRLLFLVEQLARLVDLLTPTHGRPRALAAALAANVVTETEASMRLRILRVLVREYPKEPDTLAACEGALADPSSEVRAAAAGHVGGAQGCQTLREIVENPAEPIDIRVEALAGLGRHGTAASLEGLLSRLLQSSEERLRLGAIDAMGALSASGMLEAIVPLVGLSPAFALAVAGALARFNDAPVEPVLLAILQGDAKQARAAAATALGKRGTLVAVEALLACEREGGSLGEAARDAIRRIQERLGDVGAGRLSVVEQPAAVGAVSVVPGAGELSLVAQKKS